MESQQDYYHIFRMESMKAENNLRFFSDIVISCAKIIERKNYSLENWANKLNTVEHALAFQTVKKLGDVLRTFNNQVDSTILEFNDYLVCIQANFAGGDVRVGAASSQPRLPPIGPTLAVIPKSNDVATGGQFNDATSKPPLGAVPKYQEKPMTAPASSTLISKVYRIGYTSRCRILNFNDVDQQFCYIADIERTPPELLDFWKQSVTAFKPMPRPLQPHKLFGIEISGFLCRAVLHSQQDQNVYLLLLVDCMEIFEMDISMGYRICILPPNIASIPPCAVKCKIVKFGPNTFTSLNDLGNRSIFEFRVVKPEINGQCMHIEIYALSNPFYNRNQVEVQSTGTKNRFHAFAQQLPPLASSSSVETAMKSTTGLIQSLQLGSNNNSNNTFEGSGNTVTSEGGSDVQVREGCANKVDCDVAAGNDNGIKERPVIKTSCVEATVPASKCSLPFAKQNEKSKEQQWPKLPLTNFHNSQLAKAPTVDGTTPSQQEQLCGSKVGKHLHNIIPFATNRTTKTKSTENLAIQPFSKVLDVIGRNLKLPNVDETTTIYPTNVVGMTDFFAQLCRSRTSFDMFSTKVHAAFKRKSLFTYTVLPNNMDYVLVSPEKDRIIRAKVINNLCGKQIEVFALDEGNTQYASLGNIYHWEPYCSDVPFQAILCRFNNIRSKCTRYNSANGLAYLQKCILKKKVTAKIEGKSENYLLVKLTDNLGFDIGEQMCAAGFAELLNNN